MKIGFILTLSLFIQAEISQSAENLISFKNYREILSSLEQGTGIPLQSSAYSKSLVPAYNSVLRVLPKDGISGELTTSAQLGLLTIGGAFCSAFVAESKNFSDASKRKAFRSVDFSKDISMQSERALEESVIDLTDIFWLAGMSKKDREELLAYVEESKDLLKNQSNSTQTFCETLCTMVVSSIKFLEN